MAGQSVDPNLVNSKVNRRILLGALWLCHFALWTFGDMFALAQQMTEPVTSTLILFVAPSTAIVQALMVLTSLVGGYALARWANMIVVLAYLLFNIGFLVDATEGWEYYLGALYIVFNVLIFWTALKWTTED